MAQQTELSVMAIPGMIHAFVAKTAADIVPTIPGLEWTLPVNRMHYATPENRMHYTVPEED